MKRFEFKPNQASQWKRDFLERADEAFDARSAIPRTDFKYLERVKYQLYKKVGELQVDDKTVKKKLRENQNLIEI